MLNDFYSSLPQIKFPQSYGEILLPSLAQLFLSLKLTEEDVFIDLGSGIGKTVIQAFLQTNIREARGIELIPSLHNLALQAAKKIQTEFPTFFNNRKLSFTQGDFLNQSLEGATTAFINSTCFSQELLNSLGKKVNQTQSIQKVMTLRPIETLTDFNFKKTLRVECSWDTSLCYIYARICK